MSGAARRAVAIAIVLAATAVAVRLLPVADALRALQAWVAQRGAVGMAVYAAVYVAAALLFVPGSVLTIGAGLTFGLARGAVVVSLASTAAAAIAFLIARYLVRNRVADLARRHARFGAVDAAVRDRGWMVVLLLRLSPVVPFSLSNYLYGLTAVRFVPYVLASWVGMLPGTLLYVYLGAIGHQLARGGRTTGEWVALGAGLAATALAAVLVARGARRALPPA